MKEIKRFFADKDRGISIALFSELCGVDRQHMMDVFIHERYPVSEYVQTRVNRGYLHWKQGKVRVMKRVDNTRYVYYRRAPNPPVWPKMGLKMTSEGVKISVGMVNRHDYSEPDLKEQLGG
mgnify:CR=1 FL=1